MAGLLLLAGGAWQLAHPAAAPGFDRVAVNLRDTRGAPAPNGDRVRHLYVTGAPCDDYFYSEAWARRAGLPEITDLQVGESLVIYADARACAGLDSGRQARLRAILYAGRLYATEEFRRPPDDRLTRLSTGVLLVAFGLGALLLAVRRRRGKLPPTDRVPASADPL